MWNIVGATCITIVSFRSLPRWWNKKSRWYTPPKTNMEPENGPLEKEIPIGNHHFQVPAVNFLGCIPPKTFTNMTMTGKSHHIWVDGCISYAKHGGFSDFPGSHDVFFGVNSGVVTVKTFTVQSEHPGHPGQGDPEKTVDGSEIRVTITSWGNGSWNPIIYKVLAPSQVVVWDFSHQQ